MSGKKMSLKYAPECWKTHLREFQISNFSWGACPRTPLEGPQHAVLATQAQFTSAAYSVQIRHLLHFLMTTLKKTSEKICVLAHMRNVLPMQAKL